MKNQEKTPDRIIMAAAALTGVNSVNSIATLTGIKQSTLDRRMKNFATFRAGELAALMHEFPLSDEEIGRMIREVYK